MTHLPDTCFHYTTQIGLLGILDSNALWATRIHHLNDSLEYGLALSLVRTVLDSRLASQAHPADRIRVLATTLTGIEQLNVCVVSFSSRRDLLSQWRAYGGAAGYSLGFRTAHIREAAARQGFALEQCVYDETIQRAQIEQLVDEHLSKPSAGETADGGMFAVAFAKLAPLIKSAAFSEEAEWRLSIRGALFQNMCFRPGLSAIIPYVPFALDPDIRTYLESVTIGPTPHPALAERAIFARLAKAGAAGHVPIHQSKVPYRNW